MGELRVQLFEMLRQSVRPEFLNRIDEIILFKPLTMTELRKIVELQLLQVQKLVADKNITLEFTDEAKERLADNRVRSKLWRAAIETNYSEICH
jgi:ATP-dependent Clp protease ATP-binding subunit ClpA